MPIKYSFKLTEEISRWAFEICINRHNSWFIAFTNPTAGPWKRIMGRNSNGEVGEVHRFEREEMRPDLVLVCDELQVVLIIEAKDSLTKLLTDKQMDKSADVVRGLAQTLRNKKSKPFWGERAFYTQCR